MKPKNIMTSLTEDPTMEERISRSISQAREDADYRSKTVSYERPGPVPLGTIRL